MRSGFCLNRFLRIGLLCLFVVFAVANAGSLAQERFSSIVGVISDPSKAVMPGVEITIQNLETKRTFRTTSGNDGKYYARDLEPGRYSISARKEGFTRAEFSDVILLLGKTINLNFTLQVGQLTESVIVLGTSTLIDTNTTAVTHNVTSDEFDFMPKDRSFQSVALTSPSVNSGQIEGGIQVNGASGAENQYTIDGISTTSLLDGTSRQNAPYEFLQEVQVKTSGLEAEYGGALGGVISAVTKSGGNAFHGEFHWYNSGSPFNADPRVRMAVDPNDLRTIKYFQDQKTTNHVNEVGGSVSGPIVKDKLFFFTSFTPTFRHLEANIRFSDGSSTFTSSERMYSLFDKLTWDATKRIRTNFSWLYTTDKRKGLMAGYNAMSANSNLNTINTYDSIRPQGWYLPKDSYTGTVDVTLSNTSLLSFRGGYFWDNYKVVKAPSTTQLRYNMSATNLPFTIPDSLIHPSGWFNVPLTNVTYFDITSRGYFQADYSKTFRLLGSHNLKGGAGFQKNVNKVFTGYQGGGYNVAIYWDGSFTSPSLGAGRGTYGYYRIKQVGTTGSAGSTIDNMYIQDQWRILPRLSLSLGLRAEKENIPSFRRDIQEYVMQFGWGDKLAPRLGGSYDVFGNGKLKVFGSWGRFFDWTKYSMVRDSFGGYTWREWYHALDTTDIFSLGMTNMPGANLWNNTPGSYRDFSSPSFDSSAIDPDIKPMRQDTTVIGAEYQFTPITVFSAHYVHSILNRTIEDIGQILPDGNSVYPLGNPGEGVFQYETNHISATPDFAMPKPKRQYDALELAFNRRFSANWFIGVNYTYSRLFGNYSGLSDTDEIAVGGWATDQSPGGMVARPGTNITTYNDDEAYLLDSKGRYLYGRLATDRPHVFKAYGSYKFKWGTSVSANFYAGSGTPLSTNVEDIHWDVMIVNGRGDMGRTPALTQTDLMVSHEFKIKEGKILRFEFNVENLFNQETVRHRDPFVNRFRDESSEMDLSNVNLLQGFNWQQLFAQSTYAQDPTKTSDPNSFDPLKNFAVNPTYKLADLWNPGFSGRFAMKFVF